MLSGIKWRDSTLALDASLMPCFKNDVGGLRMFDSQVAGE